MRGRAALGRCPVARCDDAFDIVARQVTGQCRELLSGNRRHRSDKPGPAKASSARKRRYNRSADVSRRTSSRDAVSRRHRTAFLISVALYRADHRQDGEEAPHGLVVALDGPLTDAAITPQPDQETCRYRPGSSHVGVRARRGDARANQVLDEQPIFER